MKSRTTHLQKKIYIFIKFIQLLNSSYHITYIHSFDILKRTHIFQKPPLSHLVRLTNIMPSVHSTQCHRNTLPDTSGYWAMPSTVCTFMRFPQKQQRAQGCSQHPTPVILSSNPARSQTHSHPRPHPGGLTASGARSCPAATSCPSDL